MNIEVLDYKNEQILPNYHYFASILPLPCPAMGNFARTRASTRKIVNKDSQMKGIICVDKKKEKGPEKVKLTKQERGPNGKGKGKRLPSDLKLVENNEHLKDECRDKKETEKSAMTIPKKVTNRNTSGKETKTEREKVSKVNATGKRKASVKTEEEDDTKKSPISQTDQEKVHCIMLILNSLYPNPPIPLDHFDAFTLLIAVILSK